MRTPKEYSEFLKKGIVTGDMLSDAIFSVNKRAKNYRDKVREYRRASRGGFDFGYHFYDNYEAAEKKRDEYYSIKERLLRFASPACIHREFQGYERKRIYDYEKAYRKNLDKFVWENCYYDYEEGREVWFGDIETSAKRYAYYLYYFLPGHTFHSPIDKADVPKHPDLSIEDSDTLETFGEDVSELLSVQFVRKVLEKLVDGSAECSISKSTESS